MNCSGEILVLLSIKSPVKTISSGFLSSIFLTEGVFDALSLPVNGLPILGTMIPLEILRFVYNKNIVLCFDNDYQSNLKEEMIKKLFLYGCKSISEFKIPSEYKDLNDFKIKDEKGLLSIFKEIINQINA